MGKDKKDNYPTPKKGERVKCLACNGTGIVYVINRGVSKRRTCMGCNGEGSFVAD